MPVPWVPVASAPASDWASMSPRFGIASPRACSSRESALQADAGLDADEPGLGVGVEHAVQRVEADQRALGRPTPALNECPAPATRTGAGPSAIGVSELLARARQHEALRVWRAASRTN